MKHNKNPFLSLAVWVVALGYFVDIFDLTLFSMLRIPSLQSLGVSRDELVDVGILLLNSQMAGLLFGGILWGILGDKKGRLKVLFGSILLYSLANVANAFVQTTTQYAVLRFISGLGLAGELGAGITLVSEALPHDKRGWGTTVVAAIGVLGATFGGFVVERFTWSASYLIGGGLGLSLLFLRIKVAESELFHKAQSHGGESVQWGSLSMLTSPDRRMRFLNTILIGMPIWYVVGIVMSFSPELANENSVLEPITAAKAISVGYLGLAFGDFFSGALSQWFRSRKKSVLLFKALTISCLALIFFTTKSRTGTYYYFLCFLIGLGAGYWAVFVTMAAEQFGTNLRATVATTAPNFVRGSTILMTLSFKFLKEDFGILKSMILVGIVIYGISLVALYFLPETFHRKLDYFER